jgi:acetyltransferase-like isoleucine patch superfamily enzyme
MTSLISASEADAITGRWDYLSLPANVRLGKDCYIEREASFKRFRSKQPEGLILGDRVIVYTWTEFNIEPEGSLMVGDDSVLVGAVFMCAERVRIGKRVVISYNVTIADSDFHPIEPEARKLDARLNAPFGKKSPRPPILTAPVEIEDEVQIGIGAIILKGVHIGRGAIIQAGAVVSKNVACGATVAGNPAKPVEK